MNPIIQTILDQQDPPDDPYNPSNASVAADNGTGNVPAGAYRYASLNPTRPDTSGLESATRELGAAARRRAKAQREAAEEEENARRAQMGAGIGAEIARLISGQNIQTNTRRNMEAAAQAASNRRRAEADEAGIDAESRAQAAQRIAEINRAADASLREQEATEAQRRVAAYNRRQDAINREALREEGVSERREDRAAQREYQEERDEKQYQRSLERDRIREEARRERAAMQARLRGDNNETDEEGSRRGFVPGESARQTLSGIMDATVEKDGEVTTLGDFWPSMLGGGGSTIDNDRVDALSDTFSGQLKQLIDRADTKTYRNEFSPEFTQALTQAYNDIQSGDGSVETLRNAAESLQQTNEFQYLTNRSQGRKYARNYGLSGDQAEVFGEMYAENRAEGYGDGVALDMIGDQMGGEIDRSSFQSNDSETGGDQGYSSAEEVVEAYENGEIDQNRANVLLDQMGIQ